VTSAGRWWSLIPWALAAIAVAVLSGTNDYILSTAIVAVLSGIVAVGLNFLMGYAGLINLSSGVFYALGAYGSAKLTIAHTVPPAVIIVGMPAAAFIVGAIVGLPILRTRGLHFAVATLGLGLIVTDVLDNWEQVTNGPIGLVGVVRPSKLGPLDPQTNQGFFLLSCLVLALVMIGATAYHRSRVARVLIASRDDELLMRSLGFNVAAYKVFAFALSAAVAAVAGVLYAWFIQFIAPPPFTFFALSFPVFVMVAVGGPGSLWGPVVGAAFLTALPELLHAEARTKQIIYGAVLLAVIVFLRRGIAPTFTRLAALALARVSGRRGLVAEPPQAAATRGAGGLGPAAEEARSEEVEA
jgi:branched-chain amino acid transport system permease protein